MKITPEIVEKWREMARAQACFWDLLAEVEGLVDGDLDSTEDYADLDNFDASEIEAFLIEAWGLPVRSDGKTLLESFDEAVANERGEL